MVNKKRTIKSGMNTKRNNYRFTNYGKYHLFHLFYFSIESFLLIEFKIYLGLLLSNDFLFSYPSWDDES